ncbi:WD40 repeat domain-containing protein [Actinoplanes sp. NPDC051861]|uniref:WD40 repeat domain-containing protein n=1 Tax=Actinoplanes sp. NPDC051861 TaxID=3155170 RepID=UPI00343769A4
MDEADRLSSIVAAAVSMAALGATLAFGLRKGTQDEPASRLRTALGALAFVLLAVIAVAAPIMVVPRVWAADPAPDKTGPQSTPSSAGISPAPPRQLRWNPPELWTNAADEISALALSPNGRLVAAGDSGGFVWVYDLRTADLVREIRADSDYIEDVTFTPDGTTLAAAGWDKKIRLYTTADWSTAGAISEFRTTVKEITYSGNGDSIAALSGDEIKIIDVGPRAVYDTVEDVEKLKSMTFIDSEETLLVADLRSVRLWDVDAEQYTRTLFSGTGVVREIHASPDRRYFGISGYGSDSPRIRDTRTGEVVRLDGQPASQGEIAFSAHTNLVAVESEDSIVVWDLPSGHVLDTLDLGDVNLDALEFGPGDTIIAGCSDHVVRVWTPE